MTTATTDKRCPHCYGTIGGAHEAMCPLRGPAILLGDAWLTKKQLDKKYGADIPEKYQTDELPPFLRDR